MKKICGLVIALVLTACGSSAESACNGLQTALTKFNTSAQACGANPSASVSISLSQCIAAVGTCSTGISATNTFTDCLNGLPACTQATASDWASKADACSGTFVSATSGCK